MQGARHIDGKARLRIVDRGGDRHLRSFVEDALGALAGSTARLGVTDVAFEELDLRPAPDRADLETCQVRAVSRREIVQDPHSIAPGHEGPGDVRADEARTSRDNEE